MEGLTAERLLCDVCNARRELFRNVESANELFYLNEERVKIRKTFDQAFQYRLSTSLIIVGSSATESINLVKTTLEAYCTDNFQAAALSNRYNKDKNYTARINGSLHVTDQEALADLANQFLVRSDRETASSLALEDLEDHFRQCRLDGIPAIIVIEDFHVFTKRKRQTLIYALLDLMHKKDLLFTVSVVLLDCLCRS
jgi:Cdc6-like AAA superfamily ATPase